MIKLLRHIFRKKKKSSLNNKMEEAQTSDDTINATSDALSYLSITHRPDFKYKPMPDPLSVYVPLNSLTEKTIDSIVSTILHSKTRDYNNSKRTLLAFLLAINSKVSEIEQSKDSNNKFDEQTIRHVAKVRQWLVDRDQSTNVQKIDWDQLRAKYDEMASEKGDGAAKVFGIDKCQPYYELIIEGVSSQMNC